jgi:hypothetical protein
LNVARRGININPKPERRTIVPYTFPDNHDSVILLELADAKAHKWGY